MSVDDLICLVCANGRLHGCCQGDCDNVRTAYQRGREEERRDVVMDMIVVHQGLELMGHKGAASVIMQLCDKYTFGKHVKGEHEVKR